MTYLSNLRTITQSRSIGRVLYFSFMLKLLYIFGSVHDLHSLQKGSYYYLFSQKCRLLSSDEIKKSILKTDVRKLVFHIRSTFSHFKVTEMLVLVNNLRKIYFFQVINMSWRDGIR